MSSISGQFYDKVATAAKEMKKSEILWEQFQFTWLDGPEIVSGIAMTKMAEPAILVFNYTSYEFFMPFDEPEKMTSNSIITWLEQLNDGISSGNAVALGGRGWLTRVRRLVYDLYTNVAQMFSSQPLLSCCLFGVPIAFLSVICYRYEHYLCPLTHALSASAQPIFQSSGTSSTPKRRRRRSCC